MIQQVAKHPRYQTKIFAVPLESLFSMGNLLRAFYFVRPGKTHRNETQVFVGDAYNMLSILRDRILRGAYTPQDPHFFRIWCISGQKIRDIYAPHFVDLIVQACLYLHLRKFFNSKFVATNCGCRKGKGTRAAADYVEQFSHRIVSKKRHNVQLDIKKYYYSIDLNILRGILYRFIADCRICELLMKFTNEFQHKTVGICIGNLLAQLFGLIYLNVFDHYVKRVLKVKYYVRYVDDMVFINLTKSEAKLIIAKCRKFLHDVLHLTLSKAKDLKVYQGINFVGYRTFRKYRVIRKRSLKNFLKALQDWNFDALDSIAAHTEHTASYKFIMSALQKALELAQESKRFIQLPGYLSRRLTKWQSTHIKSSKQKAHTEASSTSLVAL
jgi:transposase-like protein